MTSTKKKGFTLIELLIVVVIIGILAAIAIPKFANTKEKAYLAAMKSDLRNLATTEETYASDNNGYYGTAANVVFTGSAGVTLNVVPNDGLGWGASATTRRPPRSASSSLARARLLIARRPA